LAPRGIWPARKSALRSEPFSTFNELTEFGLSCSAPTLFLGITIETAATLVPASATKRAAHAITIEGVGLRLRSRFIGETSSLVGSSMPFAAERIFTSL
jgi:hypothetical protein